MNSSQTSPTSVTVGFPDIALAGKAGAGKSTAADLLVELGYVKNSIAGPLKDVAAVLWEPAARTDRGKLQKLGVAVREIEQDTWINVLIRRLGSSDGRAPIVVDDLRFPNEYWALKAEGFVVVRVGADRNRRIDRLKGNGKFQSLEQLEHESETAIDALDMDYAIENDATKEELYDDLVGVILKERRRR